MSRPFRCVLGALLALFACADSGAKSVAASVHALAAADETLASRLTGTLEAWRSDGDGAARTPPPPPRGTAISARLPATADGAWEVGLGERHRLALTPRGAAAAKLELAGTQAVYRDAYPATDGVYVAANLYVEQFLLLRDERAPSEFSWDLRLGPGLRGVRGDGSGGLEFVDANDRAVLRLPRPIAVDARGVRRQGQAGWDGERVAVRLETAGLSYPVLLDPVVEVPAWTKVPYIGGRLDHAMAELNGKLVLFGGGIPVAQMNGSVSIDGSDETWEWDGARWEQKRPARSPPARLFPGLATFGSKVVLFGGTGFSNFNEEVLGDTWEWDGVTWTEKHPAHSPGPRARHAMATLGGKLVLFGGTLDTDVASDETWEWDGNDWTRREPGTRPPAGPGLLAPLGGRLVLLQPRSGATWEWDGTDWTPKQAALPPATYNVWRALAPLANGKVALFSASMSGVSAPRVVETWEWDGSTWSQRAPTVSPPYRTASSFASLAGRAVLFGGTDAYNLLDDLWEWEGTTWKEKTRRAPPARGLHGMATVGSTLVLHGGLDNGRRLTDTWGWNGSGWQEVATSNHPPASWPLALVSVGAQALQWSADGGTWLWNGTDWSKPQLAVEPSVGALHAFNMASLGGHRALLLGSDGKTWDWDSGWTLKTTPNAPRGRHGQVMAGVKGRAVFFGASAGAGETWEWAGTQWEQKQPAINPPPRESHALASSGMRALLFGGYQGTKSFGDTWEWDGTNWSELLMATHPFARAGHSMAEYGDRVLLFGGGDFVTDDTWEFRLARLDGSDCTLDSECVSGFCVDGVCCGSACSGPCEACNVAGREGTCVPIAGAPRGRRPACPSDGSVCGGTCDGAIGYECTFPGPAVACREAACLEDVATLAGTCDGLGACGPLKTLACAPYRCGGASCAGDCDDDADCQAGHYCPAGICVPEDALGSACSEGRACASGHCVDGVCCEAACDGQCQACSVDGRCTVVVGAPRGARPPCLGSGTCAGACDGVAAEACRYPGAETLCRVPSCGLGIAAPAASCDGAGGCPEPATQLCAPFACAGSVCAASCSRDAECAGDRYCSGGACVIRLEVASACSSTVECASGHCVDGVCCESACDGACEACDLTGNEGRCVKQECSQPVEPEPDGCGCGAAGAPLPLLAAILLGLRRRRRA